MSFADAAASPMVPAQLDFPDGLVGLPALHAFTAEAIEDSDLIALSTPDDGGYTFAAVPADTIRLGMTADLTSRGFAPADSILLVLLSVHGTPPAPTANLAGPIVVDPILATARQIVLEDPAYPLRASVGGD